jgi:hypothetical protein
MSNISQAETIWPSHFDKWCFRRFSSLIYDFHLLKRISKIALEFDEPADIEETIELVTARHGIDTLDRESLHIVADGVRLSNEFSASVAAKGLVSIPPHISIEDFYDHMDGQMAEDFAKSTEPIQIALRGVASAGASGPEFAALFELIGGMQPLGGMIREGILAVACGALERHFMKLATLIDLEADSFGGEPSSKKRGRTESVHYALDRVEAYLGNSFDPKGTLSPNLRDIIATRNSILHREGRIDEEFKRRVKSMQIDEDYLGAILDLDNQDLGAKLSYLASHCFRSTYLLWHRFTFNKYGPDSSLRILRSHLLAQDDWIALAIMSDDVIEGLAEVDDRAVTRVNHLLGLKRLTDNSVVEEFYERVRQWNEPPEVEWILPKLALLDDIEGAVTLIEKNVDLRELLVPANKVFSELMGDPRARHLI